MRTDTFKGEFRRIRDNLFHVFHHHVDESRAHRSGRASGQHRAVEPRLTIRDIMRERPITVRPESSLGRALALMIDHHVGGLPVVDADNRIVGALNENDLMKIFSEPEATTVAAVMSRDPVAISVDASLVEVTDQMMSSDFRRLLVHDQGRLVGILTRRHVLPAILEALEDSARARQEAWLQ